MARVVRAAVRSFRRGPSVERGMVSVMRGEVMAWGSVWVPKSFEPISGCGVGERVW